MSFCVRVGFSRLRPSKVLADRVEEWCRKIQELCVRATHLSNHAVLMPDFPQDELYLFTEDHSWWRHCMMLWTVPAIRGKKPDYSPWLLKAKDDLEVVDRVEPDDRLLCINIREAPRSSSLARRGAAW
jgi:hypothetical protein